MLFTDVKTGSEFSLSEVEVQQGRIVAAAYDFIRSLRNKTHGTAYLEGFVVRICKPGTRYLNIRCRVGISYEILHLS